MRLSVQGPSYRHIAQSVGISASTVPTYLERAQRAGLSWPPPDAPMIRPSRRGCSKTRQDELRPARPEPNWLEVHRERKRGQAGHAAALHLEYKATHPEGLSYAQFCVHYRRWLAQQDVVMRLDYAAAHRMFVDFAGDTVSVTDPDAGEVWQARVFVSVLGATGYRSRRRPVATIWPRGWVLTSERSSSPERRHE